MSWEQPADFRAESDALCALLEPLGDSDFERPTQFKDWSLHDVIAHLHLFNRVADMSLCDRPGYDAFFETFNQGRQEGRTFKQITDAVLGDRHNRAMFEDWRDFYPGMAERFAAADPKARIPWAGRDMSARSSISARLMETWAHGQEVYDTLGVVRQDHDRIRNVAILGVNTFGFNFSIRGLEVPSPVPRVRLTAPSGGLWEWNAEVEGELVEGPATDFCQVVAQTRNVADTRLRVSGEIATRWMSIAQCFAGTPSDPPPPGSRFTQKS